ncbi:MAG: LPS export ABC transporter permease LptG [Pseudomonadales bacterium]|nr:LPS export ABC transporter permease LptG [Pseudomonadales bacterium]
MTLLDRYVIRSMLGGVVLVMIVLLVLGALFIFVGQQDDIGTGSYTVLDALWFTALNIPQQVYELLPISALIGALVGLGTLARGSEITIMRAAGWSVWRLAGAVALGALLLFGFAVLVGEYLGPPLQQMAKQQKAFRKFANVSFGGHGGAWVRDGRLLINVAQQSSEAEFAGMRIFELSPRHELLAVARAAGAEALADGSWRLRDFAESRFANETVSTTAARERTFTASTSSEFLGLTVAEPSQLETRVLWRLIANLQANGLDARPQVFAFWSRIARTAAILFACLLAVPFVSGSMRAGSGARTAIGLLLGIGFFLLQRMVESGAIVFDVSPVLLAWFPTAVLATVALTLIARTR